MLRRPAAAAAPAGPLPAAAALLTHAERGHEIPRSSQVRDWLTDRYRRQKPFSLSQSMLATCERLLSLSLTFSTA